MQQQRSGQARAVLSEVQNRHMDIKKIEKTILELHELFIQMNMLVEQQGEVLKEIDMHAQDTVIQLDEGNKQVDRAIVSARATRTVSHSIWLSCLILVRQLTPSIEKMVLRNPGDRANLSGSFLYLVVCIWRTYFCLFQRNVMYLLFVY